MWRLAMLLAILPGCGSAMLIHVRAPRPAAIPARAFPVVCVAGSADDESQSLADALAEHLGGGEIRVVRTEADRLLADAAMETPSALALLVTVTLGETISTRMAQVPSLSCSTAPCYGYPQRLPVEVRVQVGDVLVRAIDPHSAADLGRAGRHAEESEPSPVAARLAVIERLRTMVLALVDVTYEVLDLELDDAPDARARAAVESARTGDVHAARVALEARLLDPTLPPPSRIAITFDHAQLLRADVAAATDVTEETTRLSEAEAEFVAVVREAPDERHERALTQLRAERAAREDVRAQQAATEQNFGR